jgi:magnesium transporter
MPNNIQSINKDTQKIFIYLSGLLEKPVFDKNGNWVAKVYDIAVKPTQVYPASSALIIRKGFPNRRYAVIPWQDVLVIDYKEARINIEADKLVFFEKHDNKEEFTLRRDILDQQVVDTYNHKVIRVNDVHLLPVDRCFMIAHVDISTRGLVRRLGFEKLVDFLVGLFNGGADYLNKEYLISWKHIQPLSINPVSMTIKINIPQRQFNNIPAADLGEIFQDLSIQQQASLFKSLDVNTKARIFAHIDFKTQNSLVDELEDKELADVLNNMPSDETTDFLEKLPQAKVKYILSLIESKYSSRLSQLLGYSSDSAGGLMTTEYIAFARGTLVGEALLKIKERKFKVEPAQLVYIIDDESHLIGSTNFRRLISADAQDEIQKAAFPKTYFVHLESSVKEVAYLMEKYKYYAIPVVDANNILQGIVTVDDILSQVISIAWRRLKKIRVLPKQ